MRAWFVMMWVMLLLGAGCQRKTPGQAEIQTPFAGNTQRDEPVKFPFPQIPLFITGAEERMAYVLEHFWQAYDFNDTTETNLVLGEQGFADFLNLLSHADSAMAFRAVQHYLSKGYAKDALRARYAGLIRHYLDNPDSPLRNDVTYMHFLRAQMELLNDGDLAERERCAFLLRMVGRNLPGSVARDFVFEDRKGVRRRMHSVASPFTLLIFNDPECETCKEMMPKLLADPLLQREELAVLAIYPDSDTEMWKTHGTPMPERWIDACTPNGEVMHNGWYYLPAMPSLYLLDAQKRVLLKDATHESLRQYFIGVLNRK